jgi:hypothetical protein
MPKTQPQQPWPLLNSDLEREARLVIHALLTTHPERQGDLGDKKNLHKIMMSYQFYREQGFPIAEIGSHLMGIDFDQKVEIVTMPPPNLLSQWQIPALGTESPRVGCYWTIPEESTPRSLGINPQGPRFDQLKGRPSSGVMMNRTEFNFQCSDISTPKMLVLKTRAAPIIDDWTDRTNPRSVYGGNEQHFSKELGDHYKIMKDYQLATEWRRDSDGQGSRQALDEHKVNEINKKIAAAAKAINTVMQKLNSVRLKLLKYPADMNGESSLFDLNTLQQEHEKAAKMVDKAAEIIDELAYNATYPQKYAVAQALNYSQIIKKDIKKIFNSLEGKSRLLPPIIGKPGMCQSQSEPLLVINPTQRFKDKLAREKLPPIKVRGSRP